MWRGVVGSCWLGQGCLILRVDTRENPGGKNGVMTGVNERLVIVITPFLPPGFSRVSARKTRQPEPSRPVLTRAHHLEYSQKEGPRHISQGLTKFD
jgi:hypothetical protein